LIAERNDTMDPDRFAIATATRGDALVITVAGEVDLATSPELARAVEGPANGAVRVVADLSAITFLDSSGISTLVRAQCELTRRGLELHVVATPDGPVRRVLELMSLNDLLTVVDSLDAALGDGGSA
jgi:anti-anti-sigma factor